MTASYCESARRVTAASATWMQEGRRSGFLLASGGSLDKARRLRAEDFDLTPDETAFIKASDRRATRAKFAKRVAGGGIVALVAVLAIWAVQAGLRRSEAWLIAARLQKATPSVYLVLTRVGEVETPIATACVIDQAKGLLATNAHVAEFFERLSPGQRMIVRSSGANPQSFVVDGSVKHPGYKAFKELSKKFDFAPPDRFRDA